MNSSVLAPTPPAPPAEAPPATSTRRRLAAAALIAAFAVGLRWWRHGTTFDVFVDEFVYQQLGSSVRTGGLPRFTDGPFFLHPPGFFYLVGGWERLTGADVTSDPIQAVFDARELNAVLGGLTAGLLVWIMGRRSVASGLLPGLVFAVEPFVLRQNGRVLLETAALVWVLVGVAVLQPLMDSGRGHRRAAAGGVALGCAVLTNDRSVMLTLVPLVLLWLLHPRQRPWIPTALAATALPYGLYVGAVAATGHLGQWEAAKFSGVLRVLGLSVTTGFTAPGAPSLTDQLLGQAADFGATYVLLALGGIVALTLLRAPDDGLALLALVYAGAFVLLAYSATAGTLEEHFLYYLLVPSVALALGTAGRTSTPGHEPLLRRLRRRAADRWPRLRVRQAVLGRTWRTSRVPVLVLATLVVGLDTATYVRWHEQPDDGFARVRAYLVAHAAPGTGIAIVQGTSEFAFRDRYRVGPYTSDEERVRYDVQYLVVPWREVRQGYTYVTLPTVRELVPQGQLVLSVRSRTYGRVALYRLPPPVQTGP